MKCFELAADAAQRLLQASDCVLVQLDFHKGFFSEGLVSQCGLDPTLLDETKDDEGNVEAVAHKSAVGLQWQLLLLEQLAFVRTDADSAIMEAKLRATVGVEALALAMGHEAHKDHPDRIEKAVFGWSELYLKDKAISEARVHFADDKPGGRLNTFIHEMRSAKLVATNIRGFFDTVLGDRTLLDTAVEAHAKHATALPEEIGGLVTAAQTLKRLHDAALSSSRGEPTMRASDLAKLLQDAHAVKISRPELWSRSGKSDANFEVCVAEWTCTFKSTTTTLDKRGSRSLTTSARSTVGLTVRSKSGTSISFRFC